MEYLNRLSELAESLESKGQYKEAYIVHDMFIKEADKFKPKYMVEFPMNMDDALNNYDSQNYEVDSEGDWEESEPISEFREELSDETLHAPAAVDDNHIIFENNFCQPSKERSFCLFIEKSCEARCSFARILPISKQCFSSISR